MLFRCPNCASIDVGKIGTNQFYCWNCYVEMTAVGDKMKIHQVEADGSLSSLDEFVTEDGRETNG